MKNVIVGWPMSLIYYPGIVHALRYFSGELDSITIPGLLYPNQQLSIGIVINSILGGSAPAVTFSLDQLNPNGQGWTSIWSSGAQSAPGSIGPTIVSPPGTTGGFDPSGVRLSWTLMGAPTTLDFTPALAAA